MAETRRGTASRNGGDTVVNTGPDAADPRDIGVRATSNPGGPSHGEVRKRYAVARLAAAYQQAMTAEGVPEAVARSVEHRVLFGNPCGPTCRVRVDLEYPVRAECAACRQPVLVVESRVDAFPLMFDPGAGEGPHYDTILSADKARVEGSGESLAENVGGLPVYRAHAWSCPARLAGPGGVFGAWWPEVAR